MGLEDKSLIYIAVTSHSLTQSTQCGILDPYLELYTYYYS